uniref:Serine/arginine repetitive matrix protein 2 n=1 Tax=Schistosoma mansoni TaxID=6183 RepID=A0A3Q0KQZ4_SCHMA
MDKKLVDNYVKHATTHNRLGSTEQKVLEEEQCWREIKRRHKRSNESRDRSPESNCAQSEQALDAYERALRTEAKRSVELLSTRTLPSAAGGQNAKEFWRTLARRHCDTGRWGHDGWDELQKEGPIPFKRSESIDDMKSKSVTPSITPKLPYQHTVDKLKEQEAVTKSKKKTKHKLSESKSKQKHAKKRKAKLKKVKKHKKTDKKKKKNKKKSKVTKRRPPTPSSSSSSSSSSTSSSSSSSSPPSPAPSSSTSSSSCSASSSSIGTDDEIEWQELKVK